MNPFRSLSSQRPLAVRSTAVAIGVALAASAFGSVLFTVALHDTVASGLITFVIFGGLAAMTAGVLAWELASLRVCPRCGRENAPASVACAGCGWTGRRYGVAPAFGRSWALPTRLATLAPPDLPPTTAASPPCFSSARGS